MWIPKTQPLVNTVAAIIESDYEDLLYDDQPILFTGLNRADERIVASSVENEKEGETYFHALIDDGLFGAFVRREVSYPELLRQARLLFLVNWTAKERPPTVYALNYSDIPSDYMPDAKAFCPERQVTAI